jgi:hypothetical protein
MLEGTSRIQGTFFGLLAIGLSWMKLFFTDAGTRRRVEVLQPWIDRRSHCCPRCGALVIRGIGHGRFPEGEQMGFDDSKEDTPCLECGGVIPAGESVCGKCGWTFKK